MGYNWDQTLKKARAKGFDPDQPRDPAGSPTGGQWTAMGINTNSTRDADPVVQRFSGNNFRSFNEAGQADKLLRARYQKWADGLTKDEVEAIKTWQIGQYERINERLMGDEVSSEVAPLDSAINKSAAPYNIITLRAIRSSELKVGDVFTQKGYTSTTIAPYVLDRYRQQRGSDAVVMRIRIRGGQRAAYLSAAHDTGDYEVLLPRNATFRVSDISTENMFGTDVKVIDVEYDD